jgi:hypothetical protein
MLHPQSFMLAEALCMQQLFLLAILNSGRTRLTSAFSFRAHGGTGKSSVSKSLFCIIFSYLRGKM